MYKLGVNRLSALKTREYLAKGLPIATGCPIDIFEKKDSAYVCDYPNIGHEIDISRLVDFYKSLIKKEGSREMCIRDRLYPDRLVKYVVLHRVRRY